jgi:hypothetical protein
MLTLLDATKASLPRREFSKFIYDYYFGEGEPTPSTQASLSRAYRRLEDRGYIIRIHGRFQLTTGNDNLDDNGYLVAYMLASDALQTNAHLTKS